MAQGKVIERRQPTETTGTGKVINRSGLTPMGNYEGGEPDLSTIRAATPGEIMDKRWEAMGGFPGLMKDTLWNMFVKPAKERPGSWAGGIAGGIIAAPTFEVPVVGPLLWATGTGMGGMMGQGIEDVIRVYNGADLTTRDMLDHQIQAFLENFAIGAGTAITQKLATRLVQAGIKGAIKWAMTGQVPERVTAARMAEAIPSHQRVQAVIPRGRTPEKIAENMARSQESNRGMWDIYHHRLAPEGVTVTDPTREELPLAAIRSSESLRQEALQTGTNIQRTAAAQRQADIAATGAVRKSVFGRHWDRVLNHKINFWPKGTLTMGFKTGKGGKKIPIMNTKPMRAPLKISGIREDLAQAIGRIETASSYGLPKSGPVARVAKALDNGDDYVNLDDFKQMVSALRRSGIHTPGELTSGAQRSALDIAEALDEYIIPAYREMARKAGIDPHEAVKSLRLANYLAAKEHRTFEGPGGDMTAADKAAQGVLEQSVKSGTPRPSVQGYAFPPVPPPNVETPAQLGQSIVSLARSTKDYGYVSKLVMGKEAPGRLAKVLSNARPEAELDKEILKTVLKHAEENESLAAGGKGLLRYWNQLQKFGIDRQLTDRYGPDLQNTIPEVLGKIDALQKRGQSVSETLRRIQTTVRLLGHLGPTHIKRAAMWRLADWIGAPEMARRVNRILDGMMVGKVGGPAGFPLRRTLTTIESATPRISAPAEKPPEE